MQIKLYKSYGVLAHEKQPVYTASAPASEIYDRISVEIPDDLIAGHNNGGELLLTADGMTYRLEELISNRGEAPCLRWYDGRNTRYITLAERN